MFSGLKRKLTKRSANSTSDATTRSVNTTATSPTGSKSRGLGSASSPNSNPFASSSPATRRPHSSTMNPFGSPSDAPPAYTSDAGLQPAMGAYRPASTASSAVDDPYAFLKTFDTIFLIDDSGSMAGRSWHETETALETITPICTARDADGIDLYFFNHPDSPLYKNVTSASTIIEIFQSVQPSGATPTGQRLNQIMKPYLKEYEKNPETTKPINIIVITDGEPTDDVESPIISAAKKLDKLEAPAWQVGIQFFQVGKEIGAREHLKQLDDGLKEISGDDELRDIVDTVPFTGEGDAELTAVGIMKVVLGSVNRRLDRNSKEVHRKA
ncbi:hypothetical protein P153DRAFT_379433 [Dothidotthia symphoricarpi CBS 119687]|uniref:VWFA domain-containing protein n=1 Tax=Dothidotthia symphoricarpi CBS 119687 TaxID=1392245 RepID=A0A6A5ZYN2_9PLEO|nr:uncharacterized protein P153DRAFT_379433 [Dothidotthia symphoricarpi CBS 119687]KAF2124852.1 hypothetical protein P153DRAFT_379433 [Dothidotthia symphoricarpi CBS 119687]